MLFGFGKRAAAGLALASAIALGGCTDGYGYGGVSAGYGYYDDGYYGGGSPYYGGVGYRVTDGTTTSTTPAPAITSMIAAARVIAGTIASGAIGKATAPATRATGGGTAIPATGGGTAAGAMVGRSPAGPTAFPAMAAGAIAAARR